MPQTNCTKSYLSSIYSVRATGFWEIRNLQIVNKALFHLDFTGGQVKYLLTFGDYLRYKRFLLRNLIPHYALNALNLLQKRKIFP